MNKDLQVVIDHLERERGLDRAVIIKMIEESIEAAAHKSIGPNELLVKLDQTSYEITAIAKVTVVETVQDPATEISLEQAQEKFPEAEVGEAIDFPIPPEELGRIVAQTTRQGIMQRLRQVEKDMVRETYTERIGEIVYGTVNRFDKRDVILDFGETEGVLRQNERIPSEEYQIGDHITCVLTGINQKSGPILDVSRADKLLVKRLFEREVSEISDGIVEIIEIAREPGFRSKIAVRTRDTKVDPVGACVGQRGTRVKAIVRELNGEKVDIIPFSEDIRTYVKNALKPADIIHMDVDEDKKQLSIVVSDDSLSLAIGRRGQNVRLTNKLLGWHVEIKKNESKSEDLSIEEKLELLVGSLAEQLNIESALAKSLVNNGYLSTEGILAAEENDVLNVDGMTEDLLSSIKDAAAVNES
ncbi:MAG: transcription termination factor NusA [Lentisphaeria bacterium]|nr:transcription termination factor NusA [Lentisphaeria bacterium]